MIEYYTKTDNWKLRETYSVRFQNERNYFSSVWNFEVIFCHKNCRFSFASKPEFLRRLIKAVLTDLNGNEPLDAIGCFYTDQSV